MLKTGLFRAARKKLGLTHDNELTSFRDKLNDLVEQKDNLGDDEINARVDELTNILVDLPDSEDKSKLGRFLEDFRAVKEQDANVAKEAAGQVADLFEKLDSAAMADTPAEAGEEPVAEEEVQEVAEETEAPAGDEEEATDADPNPQYSLDEIYEYIKKRMEEEAQDAASEEPDETVEETDETDSDEIVEDEEEMDDEEECVTDNAPRIAVKITKDSAAKGGLLDLFNSVKGVN